MSGEIKFRIWNPETKEYRYEEIGYINDYSFGIGFGTDGSDKPLNMIWEQYTGLKDKNGKGKEVYKGDLFKVIFKDCPDGFEILGRETTVIEIIGEVALHLGMFSIKFIHPETGKIVYSPLYEFLQNPEKESIGNIYQNPELLK